jgi:hypothetical protein
MRVVYYLQTHTRPAQVTRLVEVIKAGSPDSVVLISHDASRPPLDVPRLESLPGVHVFSERGGYGDFSHLDRYFAAIDWLDEQGIDYDWLENITGQDYPLLPIAQLEEKFASATVDGYLLYAPVFPEQAPSDADPGSGKPLCAPWDAAMRYQYRHWWLGKPTPRKQRWLRPLMALDFAQPWLRLSLAFSTVGVRRRTTIFNDDFVCYGGWFFCTLTRTAARYARDFAKDNPEVTDYFRTVLAPEEAYLQTVLVNSGKFTFEPDAKRYIDLSTSRNNHSKTLGIADLDAMLASGAHWARKFDPDHDAAVLAELDKRIRLVVLRGHIGIALGRGCALHTGRESPSSSWRQDCCSSPSRMRRAGAVHPGPLLTGPAPTGLARRCCSARWPGGSCTGPGRATKRPPGWCCAPR